MTFPFSSGGYSIDGHNACASFIDNMFYLNDDSKRVKTISLSEVMKNVSLVAFKP